MREQESPAGSSYETIRRIGMGGMAEVFLARRRGEGGFEKLVVLKRPLLDNPDLDARLHREARLLAQLSHPSIAAVHEVGRDEQGLFLAMEYVDGHDLRAVIRAATAAKRLLSAVEVIALGVQIAGALHHAHTQPDSQGRPLGIVHRDISPSNILVRPDGMAKLLDFGIARAHNAPSITASSDVVGKLAYMSPEQLRGWTLDPRSDLFSLGILLWELLALRRPFGSRSDLDLLKTIPSTDVPSIRSVRPELPVALDDVLMQTLTREVEQRVPSAKALRNLLLPLLEGPGVHEVDEIVAPLMKELFGDEPIAENTVAYAPGGTEVMAPATAVTAPATATTTIALDPIPTPSQNRRRVLIASSVVGVGVLGIVAFASTDRSPTANTSAVPAPATSAAASSAAEAKASPRATPTGESEGPTGEPATGATSADATGSADEAPRPTSRSNTGRRGKRRKRSRGRTPGDGGTVTKPNLDPLLPPGVGGGAP